MAARGILQERDFGFNAGKEPFASITQLRGDPRTPLVREIAPAGGVKSNASAANRPDGMQRCAVNSDAPRNRRDAQSSQADGLLAKPGIVATVMSNLGLERP